MKVSTAPVQHLYIVCTWVVASIGNGESEPGLTEGDARRGPFAWEVVRNCSLIVSALGMATCGIAIFRNAVCISVGDIALDPGMNAVDETRLVDNPEIFVKEGRIVGSVRL